MLKPCPRCGSDNLSITTFKYDGKPSSIFTMIHCKDCGAAITRSTMDCAYRDWNTLYRPSAQMIAEGDCDGNCCTCKGKEICWKK